LFAHVFPARKHFFQTRACAKKHKKWLKVRRSQQLVRHCLWDVGNVKYSNRDEKEKALSRNLTVQLLMIRISKTYEGAKYIVMLLFVCSC
jgi:hypothetical protein